MGGEVGVKGWAYRSYPELEISWTAHRLKKTDCSCSPPNNELTERVFPAVAGLAKVESLQGTDTKASLLCYYNTY
jgi:hypothetical protein